MNRWKKEMINKAIDSLFVAGGTTNTDINAATLKIHNHNIQADARIRQKERIFNYCRFIWNLRVGKTTVHGNLCNAWLAYREFYKTDRTLNRLLKKIDGLPFEEQNKQFVKGILPVVVKYCKARRKFNKEHGLYKRTDLKNI